MADRRIEAIRTDGTQHMKRVSLRLSQFVPTLEWVVRPAVDTHESSALGGSLQLADVTLLG